MSVRERQIAPVRKMQRSCDGTGSPRCTDCPQNGKRAIVDAAMPDGQTVECATGSTVTYNELPEEKNNITVSQCT